MATSDERVEIHDDWLEHLLPAEGQQLFCQPRGPLARVDDLLNIRAARIASVEGINDEVRVSEYRRQQVVEIVCHATGELTDGFELLGLMQLRFERLPLADVYVNPDQAERLAVRPVRRFRPSRDPVGAAVGPDRAILH